MAFKKKEKKKPLKGPLDDVIAEVNKAYSIPNEDGTPGPPVIVTADNIPDLLRIPTGTLAGDYITGGGVPARLVTQHYGWEGSGKTVTTMLTMAEAQKICPLCYYYACNCEGREVGTCIVIDPEGTWSRKKARSVGCDTSKILVMRPDYAEQGIDVADALLRSGKVMLMSIDTLACLTPSGELEVSTEKWQQGLQARLVNKALRKWVTALNLGGITKAQGPALVLVNQIRMKIGVMFKNPEVQPGGNGQLFANSLLVKHAVKEKGKDADDKSTTFIQFRIRAERNKTYPPGRAGEFKLWTTNRNPKFPMGHVEEDPQILEMALRFNLIEKLKDGSQVYPGNYEKKGLKGTALARKLKEAVISGNMRGTPVTLWMKLRSKVLTEMMGPDTDQVIRLINPDHADTDPEEEDEVYVA